tara:strand:+ start:105 stop:1151 length:1047 start_codon:yes stop_codon:yes gene_type:complete
MNFTTKIVNWYSKNKRDLPWRINKNPYSVWLSEIILQQTKIQQGLPYYLRFMDEYPNVFSLSQASEQDILKLWEGLGYYSRARNLHKTAKLIVRDLEGVFPSTYTGLLNLPGIGKYTASAISSICYEERKAVLDGNVYRLLSRYFNIDFPINSTLGLKYFEQLSFDLLPEINIGDYNQALMDFGSTVCKPKLAKCDTCILKEECGAFANSKVYLVPVKTKKKPALIKYFNFLIYISNDNKTIIERRDNNGIWQKLYQFPLIETDKELDTNALLIHPQIQKKLPSTLYHIKLINVNPQVHNLSHRKLYIKFWEIRLKNIDGNSTSIQNLDNFPFPIVLTRFINSYFQNN